LKPDAFKPVCKYCRSETVEQLFSRFASPKSEESRLELLADPSNLSGLDETDPSSVARWMKKMGKEMGEDFAGEDIDQLAEEAAQEVAGGGVSSEPSDAGSPGDPGGGLDDL
jgi:hypothetical protein